MLWWTVDMGARSATHLPTGLIVLLDAEDGRVKGSVVEIPTYVDACELPRLIGEGEAAFLERSMAGVGDE